jgi:NTP pyrophosphatase (non-canonical NTP hydrolase)
MDPLTEAISTHDPKKTEQQLHINPMDGLFEFNWRFKHPTNVPMNSGNFDVRIRLMKEEMSELFDEMIALHEKLKSVGTTIEWEHVAALCKEMADVVFVIYGTALTYGIPMDKIFTEVVKSNLSKSDEKDENGKTIKGSDYHEPNLTDILINAGVKLV